MRKQADLHSFEFAKKSLDAQSEDMTSQRDYLLKTDKHKYIFLSFLLLGILLFLAIALICGKDQIALEIVKALIFISAGASGGYGYAQSKIKLIAVSKTVAGMYNKTFGEKDASPVFRGFTLESNTGV